MAEAVKKASKDYDDAVEAKVKERQKARDLAEMVEVGLGPIAGTLFKSAKKAVREAADRIEGGRKEREKY